MVFVEEEFGDPGHEEPPDAIGEDFAGHEDPGLAVGDDLEPGEFEGGFGRIAFDEGEFFGGDEFVVFREAVEGEPEGEEGQAHSAGPEEGGLPAELEDKPGDDEGSEDGGHVGAGVDPSEGERPLALREPLSADFGSAGEGGGFGDAEGGAEDGEAEPACAEGGEHGAGAPCE